MKKQLYIIIFLGLLSIAADVLVFRYLSDLRTTAYNRGIEDERVDQYISNSQVVPETRIKMLDSLKVTYYVSDTAEIKVKLPLVLSITLITLQIVFAVNCMRLGFAKK